MEMGPIAKAFVRDYLDALPEGMTKDPASLNALFGVAIGIALEKVLARESRVIEKHIHFHIPEGSSASAVGDMVRMNPRQPMTARGL